MVGDQPRATGGWLEFQWQLDDDVINNVDGHELQIKRELGGSPSFKVFNHLAYSRFVYRILIRVVGFMAEEVVLLNTSTIFVVNSRGAREQVD